jgi:hypothetical protein
VELRLQDKPVRLALDIDEGWTQKLSPLSISTYTERGDLRTTILTGGQTLTDSQIDVLVSAWEQTQLQTSDSGNLRMSGSLSEKWPLGSSREGTPNSEQPHASSGKKPSPPSQQGGIQESAVGGLERMGNMYLRDNKVAHTSASGRSSRSNKQPMNSRVWDEQEDEEQLNTKYEEVYSELDDVLTGLSESEGLTDDEYKQKVRLSLIIDCGTEVLPHYTLDAADKVAEEHGSPAYSN